VSTWHSRVRCTDARPRRRRSQRRTSATGCTVRRRICRPPTPRTPNRLPPRADPGGSSPPHRSTTVRRRSRGRARRAGPSTRGNAVRDDHAVRDGHRHAEFRVRLATPVFRPRSGVQRVDVPLRRPQVDRPVPDRRRRCRTPSTTDHRYSPVSSSTA
jgi:hypothetical protein